MMELYNKKVFNSLFLAGYMILCFATELSITLSMHNLFKVLVLFFSFLPLLLRRDPSIVIRSIIIFVFVAILDLYNGQLSSVTLYVFSAPLLAAYVLNSKFDFRILYFAFLLICITLLVACIRGNSDGILVNSRNFVSVTILFNSVLITFIKYRQSHKILLLPAFVSFVICLFAMGRGGIVCSSLVLFGIVCLKINDCFGKKVKVLLICLLSSFVLICTPAIIGIYESSEKLERIRDRGFHDYSRERIMDAYISHMDLSTIIMGYNISEDATIHDFGDNPHNSYIKVHSHMGIFIIVPLLLIIHSFFYFIRNRNYLYIVLLLTLLIRCYTDMILLNHYDFIIMIIVLSAIKSMRERKALLIQKSKV